MKRSSIETSVGIFVLIGIICVGYLTIKLGKLEWFGQDNYTLYARFQSVSGLKNGANVEIAGIQIGSVSGIAYDQERQVALVEMKIQKGIAINDDVIASVKTSGLIGDKYIKLSPGGSDNGLNPGDDISHLEKIIEEFASTDLLVIGNGRLFVDISLDFMRGPLPYFAMLVTLAKFFGVPVMIFSMTIVPVEMEMARTIIRYIVSNSDVITVREEPSKDELVEIGISPEKINVLPDAAFGLDYENRIIQGQEILIGEGIDIENKNFVGMNFRYTHLDTQIDEEYYKNLAKICDGLYEQLGVDILLISQMTYDVDNPLDDDRQLYKSVQEYCLNKEHIHILKEKMNIFETLAVYQTCDMVYSMRRHGIIFSSTQHIPVFALSGEKNTAYSMETLGVSKYLVPVSDLDKQEALQSMIEGYLERKINKNTIISKLSGLKSRTADYVRLAFEKEVMKKANLDIQ